MPGNGDSSALHSAGLIPGDARFRGKRYRQLMAGFNVYRTSPIVAESVPPPRIHTCYRGVPFAADARVVKVEPDRIVFETESLQISAIAHSDFSLVTSPLHGMTFLASPVDVDREHGRVTFTHFLEQRRGGAEQRGNLRVEPGSSIEVRLRCCHGVELTGWLLDVSVVSVAVYLKECTALDGLEDDAPVEMHAPGVPGGSLGGLQAHGRISRAMPLSGDDPGACRVVVQLSIDPALRERLEAYVAERREEIVRELSDSGSDRAPDRQVANRA